MFKSILLASVTAALLSVSAQANEWKEIRIATEGAYPPFNFVASDGSLQGFDVDIAKALCDAMEAKCEIVAQEWDGMIPGLQANKFDAVIASMSVTEDRKKQVAFSDKYYSTPLAIAVPKDSPIKSLDAEAFDGKSIGAQGGTTQSIYAEDVLGKAGADIRLYPTADEANADLKNGRLDAVISDKFPIADWVKTDGADCCYLLGDVPDTNLDTAIAMRQNDDALREQFNAAIKKIREDGTYDTIVQKYFDFDIF